MKTIYLILVLLYIINVSANDNKLFPTVQNFTKVILLCSFDNFNLPTVNRTTLKEGYECECNFEGQNYATLDTKRTINNKSDNVQCNKNDKVVDNPFESFICKENAVQAVFYNSPSTHRYELSVDINDCKKHNVNPCLKSFVNVTDSSINTNKINSSTFRFLVSSTSSRLSSSGLSNKVSITSTSISSLSYSIINILTIFLSLI